MARFLAPWLTAFRFLATTGRARQAVVMIENQFPEGRPPTPRPVALAFAHALAGDAGWPVSRAEAAIESAAAGHTMAGFAAIFLLASLGRFDAAQAGLEAYYRPGGRIVGAGQARETSVLFTPALAPWRERPAYRALLAALGLEDYWRRSGSAPDFRRSRQ